MALVEIMGFKCNKCGFVWGPHKKLYDWKNPPKICAKCKSIHWNDNIEIKTCITNKENREIIFCT